MDYLLILCSKKRSMEDRKFYLIVTAGGHGARMGSKVPKQFLKIKGKSILHTSIAYVRPLLQHLQGSEANRPTLPHTRLQQDMVL